MGVLLSLPQSNQVLAQIFELNLMVRLTGGIVLGNQESLIKILFSFQKSLMINLPEVYW